MAQQGRGASDLGEPLSNPGTQPRRRAGAVTGPDPPGDRNSQATSPDASDPRLQGAAAPGQDRTRGVEARAPDSSAGGLNHAPEPPRTQLSRGMNRRTS